MRKKYSERPEDAETFCFGPTNAVLFLSSTNQKLLQTLFEHVSLVHGQYLPHDMQLFLGGIPWMKVHIESLNSLPVAELTTLTVPPGAQSVTARLYGGKVDPGRLLAKTVPTYPSTAKMQHIQGLVVLDGVIDKTGHFSNIVALTGPAQLQTPALDAVRQWVYEPFLVNGRPVETEVQVNVIFNLGF